MMDESFIVSKSKPVRKPKTKGLYFLIKSKKIVYVGKGNDIRNRIEKHINNRKWIFDRYFILTSGSPKQELLKMETMYIEKYRPIYNKLSNPDFHSSKKNEWLDYLCIEENVADIAKELGLDFGIVNNIIKSKRRKKDAHYYNVTGYVRSRIEYDVKFIQTK